jgi:TatD DNase family protein
LLIVDSHCHLDRYPDLKDILERAFKAQVTLFLTICTSVENFDKVIAIAEAYPQVYASVGVHPSEVSLEMEKELYAWLVDKASHPKVVALGETGLDVMPHSPPLEVQERIFRIHIQAALDTGLPLVVHTRHSDDPFLSILDSYPEKPLGVLHCFTGSLECAQQAVSWGWKVSLSGILTFKNARDLQNMAKMLDLDSLLIETDAPWLAPQSYRGQTNEPSYLIETARCLADLKATSVQQVALSTTHSFFELFKKVPHPLGS